MLFFHDHCADGAPSRLKNAQNFPGQKVSILNNITASGTGTAKIHINTITVETTIVASFYFCSHARDAFA